MPYRIERIEEGPYLRVTLSGVVSRAEHEEFRAAAVSALGETGWLHVLIDVTGADPQMSLTDDFAFTSGHQTRLPPRLQTAIVHAEDAADRFSFVETVAANRGVTIRGFVDEAQALEWLLSAP